MVLHGILKAGCQRRSRLGVTDRDRNICKIVHEILENTSCSVGQAERTSINNTVLNNVFKNSAFFDIGVIQL